MIYRLRRMLFYAWSVVYFRRRLIAAVTLGFLLFVVLCLYLFPTYSATCVISVETEQLDY